MLHNVSAFKNQSPFFGHVLSSRDNLRVCREMASPGQTFLILVSLRKLKFSFIFFLILHYVSAIKNQSLFFGHVLNSRDNLRVCREMASPGQTFLILVSLRKLKF